LWGEFGGREKGTVVVFASCGINALSAVAGDAVVSW
jgi:hypothetical protein